MTLSPAARPALAKFIRLLSSDKDGEVLAAVRAMDRALKANGSDFHELASIVTAPSITSSNRTETNSRNRDDDEIPPWRHMVSVCTAHLGRFTAQEQRLFRTLQGWRGTPTKKQLNWLVALYARVRGSA